MKREERQSLLQRCIKWREANIKEKQFILILSFLVGIFTAIAALFLKFLIHQIQNFLTNNFNATSANYLYLVYPVIGIFLAGWFVRNIVKDDISHGVTKILYAISRRQGRIKRHNIWSSTIASAITIGFGGSVGAEAPIVLTGSAIGSNLGSVFKMEHRTLMLLVGCGAAGAIAGIFKAPIAGLVFTLEVLMIDLTMSSLLPLLISAVTAATVSYITTGTEAMFKFNLDQAFELERIPYVILLGIFCGLISLYFTRAMNSIEGVFGKLKNPYQKLAFGGVMLSVLIFLFPPLYGEGYDTIELLLNGTSAAEWDTVMNNSMFYGYGNLLQVYLMLIILLKVFASSATNGGGGCGGIFAPSLYLGCIAGFVFSHFSNDFAFSAYLPEKNFALMGMAGVMSGVMHAPLTGVFLIAELTGVRFGDRVKMVWRISDSLDLTETMVPSFILQPIVENAFKHGISPKEEGGVVRIRINPLRDKGLLYISVCDNGVGIQPEQLAQLKAALAQPGERWEHIGVYNVAARLRLLDKRGRLVIRSHPGRGTAIRMYLPLVELLEEDLDDDTPVDRG